MSLILAIEPDRRQVAHLVSIVRHVQGAELVLADTTERALESIGNSVPDLILVPALLSPQDDAALAAALRVIASAAHVQMLTIPTFAAPKPSKKSKGLLSAFRRSSEDDAPMDGCDPKVFAEEIASYIERANEERAAAQYYDDDQDEPHPEALYDSAEPVEASPGNGVAAEFADDEPEAELPPLESLVVTTDTLDPYVARAVEHAPVAEYAPIEEQVEEALAQEPAVEPEPECQPVTHLQAAEELAPEPEFEPTPEPEFEPTPVAELEPAFAAAEPEPMHDEAAAPVMNEYAVTPEQADPVIVEEDLPVAAAPVAKPVEELAAAPVFEDLLADFERSNLPVIEEVHAEEWMGGAAETFKAGEDDADVDALVDDEDSLDIDLSVELDAVLQPDEPASAPQPAALKPFAPVVPDERFEPMPLAAWQAWPRLDWTPPEKPATLRAVNGDAHKTAKPEPVAPVVEFVQAAFEDALEAEETARLDRFEPVVPTERVEPLPLAAWHVWPRLEGVVAEAYVEPIAPRKAAAKPEWVELMRSLREDIARRRAELVAADPTPPPAQKPQRPRAVAENRARPAAKAAPAPPPPAAAEKKRPKRARPIEDEWGLFDPEQCGFAALLDKLDEITVATPQPQRRRPTR